jgi:thymidylate synthase
MLQPKFIKTTSLSDTWFRVLYTIVDQGKQFIIDRGSNAGQKRCELDYITIHITTPDKGEMLPKVNPQLGFPDPVDENYLNDYLPYLMTGSEKEGESYTYGQRICKELFSFPKDMNKHVRESKILINDTAVYNNKNIFYENPDSDIINPDYFLNQMELMIWTYKNKGYRNNQMTLQVAKPTDMLLQDPPCLRHIDTRIQDDKLHFFPYFRSWDAFGGLPANLAAIEMMKQYCSDQIGVGNGEIIASSKGLHLYDYVFEISEAIRGHQLVNSYI